VIQSIPDGIFVRVRVIPGAGRSGLAGTRGDALLVRLRAPPVVVTLRGEDVDA